MHTNAVIKKALKIFIKYVRIYCNKWRKNRIMEFNKKLQELRKQKEMTQEELAQALYVSRAAISKWESGRGYPNIDSLKAIAKLFSITVDELLSSNELLTIAEEDNKRKENIFRDLIFGLLDTSAALLFFLPLFAQKTSLLIEEVSLITFTSISPYLKIIYLIIVSSLIVCGISTLSLQSFKNIFWIKIKRTVSLFLNIIGAIIFIISLQPYASIILFFFLIIKVLVLIKK